MNPDMRLKVWNAPCPKPAGSAVLRLLIVLLVVVLGVGVGVWFFSPKGKSAGRATAAAMAPATMANPDTSSPAPAVPAPRAPLASGGEIWHRPTDLREGDAVRIPLSNGTVAVGQVTLIRHEAGGWFRVAGALEGPWIGSFALGTNGISTGGLIQFPTRRLAYEVKTDPSGALVLRERPLGELLCLPLPRPTYESTTPPSRTRAAAQVPPLLSSRPGAAAVLYLDFDGQSVTDPLWNNGRTINAKAPNLTNTEITQIWRRVKEDFWAFDVDVTTDLTRYTGAQVGHRMRCIITPTDTAAPGAGGVAYVDSFSEAGTNGYSNDIPCWVFNFSVNGIAEAIAHEIGHTLGLHHDGRTSPAEEYYAGQGSGATGWAPIMGVGYYKTVVQWSKGEYLNANRTEDDLAIISGTKNGFGYVADEAGDELTTAAHLTVDGSDVNQPGVITAASDTDLYVFSTIAGTVNVTASPAPLSPNLDIFLELLDESGAILATSNPAASLPAAVTSSVAAGIYYLRIRGTGAGDALTTGYSAYASIGEYTISGTIPGGTSEPAITSAGTATGEVDVPFSYQIVATNSPTGFGLIGTLPAGLSFDAQTGLIAGTPTETAVSNLTLQATNGNGTGTKSLTLTIQAAGSPTITSENVARGTLGLGFGFQITATHPPSNFAIMGTLPTGISLDPATGYLSGVPAQAGQFSVLASATNANGTGSAVLTLSISNTIVSLAQALDIPGRTFSNDSTPSWQGQTAVTVDGVDAAQSAPVADDAVSAMQMTVAGPVTVSFRYRVDSEQNGDFLRFLVDGVERLSASGFIDWTEFSQPITAGGHTLRWEYRKDASGRAGVDAAWIDRLGITSATAPVITSNPFAAARAGVPFSYQITATNNPTSFGLVGTLPPGVGFVAGSSGLISGTPTEGGIFSLTLGATNSGGTGTSELIINVETGTLDLTGALDQIDLTWSNTGTALWQGETDVTHDSVDAGAATEVADNETAIMETNVEGPASLRFFWKVSSERDYDFLSFSIDGEERGRISGEVDWELKSFPIPAGVHRIAFRFRRDAIDGNGENAAWVDEVSVFPREGLPGSDSFVGAQALTGTHVEIATNNLSATLEPGEIAPFGSNYGHSLWWTWTAPETGRVIASTRGSNFDTVLTVYAGTSLADLRLIASNDNLSRRNLASGLVFNAIAGQTYFVTIGGAGDASGFISFDIHYTGRGTYLGVIQPDAPAEKIAGYVQLSVTDTLAYTGRVSFEGARYRLRGSLAAADDRLSVPRGGSLNPLAFTLATDLSNGDSTVTGTMTANGQGYHFTARRRIDAADLLELTAGTYTVLLEPATAGTTVAYGAGYGRAKVTDRGDVRFSGFLGDGRRASQGSALTFGNVWPCFLAPYRGGVGALAGDVAFDPVAANNFTGDLRWRVEDPATGTFGEAVTLKGAYYFRPTTLEPALIVNPATRGIQVDLSHRDAIADPPDPVVKLDEASQFADVPAGYSLRLNPRTGLFRGYFPAPGTGRLQALGGALLQPENRGAGNFEAFTGRGRVDLTPTP